MIRCARCGARLLDGDRLDDHECGCEESGGDRDGRFGGAVASVCLGHDVHPPSGEVAD